MDRRIIDIKLLDQARKGNQKAFTELFNYYQLRIYNYIKAYIKESELSEDLTMITFEKAFSHIKNYTLLCEFQTWLIGIAKNTVIDHVRWKNRRPEEIDIVLMHYLKSHIENPEEILISKETSIQLWNTINNMPDYRRKVILRRSHGLLFREISKENHMTLNSVLGQLRIARNQLNKVVTKKIAS